MAAGEIIMLHNESGQIVSSSSVDCCNELPLVTAAPISRLTPDAECAPLLVSRIYLLSFLHFTSLFQLVVAIPCNQGVPVQLGSRPLSRGDRLAWQQWTLAASIHARLSRCMRPDGFQDINPYFSGCKFISEGHSREWMCGLWSDESIFQLASRKNWFLRAKDERNNQDSSGSWGSLVSATEITYLDAEA